MSVRVLSVDAAALKALRKDPDYDGGPVILSALDGGDAEATVGAVDRFRGLVILAASVTLDGAGLALCCACTATYLESGTRVGPVDPVDALRLGLAGRLAERVGPTGAARLLLGASDMAPPGAAAVALGLVRASDDPLGDARALAEQLDDPAGRLLTRSLAFAARSTPAQAAAYDAELLALLDQRDDPQTDR